MLVIMFSPFGFLALKDLIIWFSIIWLWAYLVKVIQETRRDIYIFIQIVMVNNSTKRTITSHSLNIKKTTTYDVAKTKVLA